MEMNTNDAFHRVRSLTAMIKLALFEERYHEVAVLMHERTARLMSWERLTSEESPHLIQVMMLDTLELERAIAEHVASISSQLKLFSDSIPAKKAYSLNILLSSSLNDPLHTKG